MHLIKFKRDEEYKDWSCFDHALVQILVVVANSQVRTLIADVRKGFLAIVLNQELIDLKISPKRSIRKYFLNLNVPDYWKGNRLIFLYMVRNIRRNVAICFFLYSVWICKGDLNKHHNDKSNPMQSYLFCIKAF